MLTRHTFRGLGSGLRIVDAANAASPERAKEEAYLSEQRNYEEQRRLGAELEHANSSAGGVYLSLPRGNYEGTDDEEHGLMHIHRISANGERDLVASVPAGHYRLDRDEASGTMQLRRGPFSALASAPSEAETDHRAHDGIVPNATVAHMVSLGRRLAAR